MKRITSVFLVFAMLLTLTPMNIFAADDAVFSDVRDTDYYAQAATALEKLGILDGYPDGTFGAERSITRAEMAAVVCRMIDKETDGDKAAGKTAFDDVAASHWASGYINVASDEKIIEGDGNGKFRPEDDVKYEEAIKMIVCALGYGDNIEVDPKDWSAGYLEAADENGISDDLKGSKGKAATRGDVAVMTYNGLASDSAYSKIPAAPVASVAAGEYTGTKKVSLSTKTKDAEIYYTTDGTTPTVKSTKYTKEISITKTSTLKAIAVKNGVVSKGVMSVDYTIKKVSSGGGGGGGSSRPSTPSAYTVSFDLNYEGATGAPASQTVNSGDISTMPNDPERENFAFVGWHTEKNSITPFDFESEIKSNYTLYAHWIDMTDTTDTDEDGLIDSFEVYFGTDKNKQDTDEDGLNDYFELETLNTDPLKKDTDNNGIDDNLEDADNDGINNETEFSLNTNAMYYDTDHDLLSDYDEINQYNTNPLKDDTDDDGVKDGDEIAIGSNPLLAETSFTTQSDNGTPTAENPITISVSSTTDASGAGNLEIEAISHMDNYLISDSISGYLGYAYDLSTEGQLETAEITFSYDESLGTIGEDFQPRIYYLNEESQELEELPNQSVSNGKIVAEVNHFSTYILLNKVDFDEVWNTEIKPPVDDEEQSGKDHLDAVLVIDSSGSMDWNDPQDIRKTVAKEFVSKLGENDMAAVIDFDSSAYLYSGFTSDKETLNTAIDRIDDYGGTNLGRGISLAIEQFTSSETYDPSTAHKYIIMLTDGDGSYNNSLTTTASENDIVIYTIGLGDDVEESVLKSMAEGTGGQYYFASTADNLYDIFDVVIEETIDYTTDSNEDGISDYYTKLLNDGKLSLTNTSTELACCTDIFGEDSNDWDGDGLLNGEEIEIVIGGNGQPKVKMISHPFWSDIDCDGYTDYDEVKVYGTNPMKYTFPYSGEYELLKNPEYYYCTILADDYNAFEQGVTNVFDWHKTEESEKILADYFYEYASQESIEKSEEKIKKQTELETVISGVNNIIKISKHLKGITDATTGISELDRKMDKVRNFNADVFKGLPEIFKCANKKDTETALALVADAMGTIESGVGIIDDFNSTAEGFLEGAENATGTISSILSIGKNVSTFMYKDGKMINLPMPKAFTKFSQKYAKWMGSDAFAGLEKAQVVSIAFDVVELADNSAELYAVYSKLQANTEAYTEYIESIDYISSNGNGVSFVKDAAGNIMTIVLNAGDFMQHWGAITAANSVKTFISIGVDIASKNPYIGAIKAGIDLGISISGINKMTKATVETLMADSITDSFIYLTDSCIESKDHRYFSVYSYDASIKYLTQLAQSRIYCENVAKGFYKVKSVSTWIADRIGSIAGLMTNEEMLKNMDNHIKNVYSTADSMDLKLSNKLPDYSKYNSSTHTGSSGNNHGGGGTSW